MLLQLHPHHVKTGGEKEKLPGPRNKI